MGKKIQRGFLALILIVGVCGFTPGTALAEECDNPGGLSDSAVISGCISKFNGILEAISKANSKNEADLKGLQAQVAKLQGQIKALETQIKKLSADIFEREVKVGVKKELLAAKVRQDYIAKRDNQLLRLFFSAKNASEFIKDIAYREQLARSDQGLIKLVSGEIVTLNSQSMIMEKQRQNLAVLNEKTNKQATWLAGEVDKARRYTTDLGSKISALTARQNDLLAAKTGTFATTVGDVPLADDPAARPDYNPGFSPAFAGFSFGAPHFKGMSQYGAFGRSKSGQGYEQILKAYYGDIRVADVNTSFTIKTTSGAMSFEDRYMKGIAEMPSQWGSDGGMEALKAQAIAARSYALAYTGWSMSNQNSSRTICTTEACQVWKSSKASNPGLWADAVSQTRGKILVSNRSNNVVNAFYASTSGGYQQSYSSLGHTTPGLWDTTSNWTKWAEGAWEVKAGSPWFYKGWYRDRGGKTCGRSHPWLNQGEFSDIVNAVIVVANGGDTSGILPEDVRSCWGDTDVPWGKDRLAAEAGKFGGAVTSVSSIRVEHGEAGTTKNVVVSTNRGEIRFDGSVFKRGFNLRAPGALSIKGDLFNIEKK